jgi:large subunit ribosomal protein L25
MTYTFTVEKREGKISDDALCMGVVSGAEMDSVPVQMNRKDFVKLVHEAGQNNIVTLTGLDKDVEVTIKHIEQAPFTNEVHHVEFYALKRGVDMNADVPLTLVGEAPAADLEAIINQPVHSVSISCRPKDLIQEIEVDMTTLKEIGDTITVADLKTPSGITVTMEPSTVLLSVAATKEAEPDEDPEPVDAADVPEVGEGDADSSEATTEEKEA